MFIRALAIAAVLAGSAFAAPGTLVIAGGALDPANAAVWGAFTRALPNPATDTIAVIAAASAEPVASFKSVQETLARYGIPPGRVVLVQLAVRDDPETVENETDWIDRGELESEVAKVTGAGGIWFTGGDQARLERVLWGAEGKGTKLLSAIRERVGAGAAAGGTSAGAAIMSEVMILRGDGFASLALPFGDRTGADDMESGALVLGRGGALFTFGIVDQHFDAQARLGRLARALVEAKGPARGYGIDENTALIADLATGTASVAGAGSVTILDSGDARAKAGAMFGVENVSLSVATPGDTIKLSDGSLAPAAFKTKDAMAEPYGESEPEGGGGMAFPPRTLEELIGEDLTDNAAVSSLDRWSFDEAGAAVIFRFSESELTGSVWGRDDSGRVRYAISGVRFDILPARVSLEGPMGP
jgi:cyanophycinase